MKIEWDPNKAQLNYTKHGVLFDPNALTIEDTRARGDQLGENYEERI